MRKSCHDQNNQMLEAYQIFQNGNYNQALEKYENMLKNSTFNSQYRNNLAATIATISISLEILENHLNRSKNDQLPDSIKLYDLETQIRLYCNLIFLKLLNAQFEVAEVLADKLCSEIRNSISVWKLQTVQSHQLIRYVLILFFRVESLQQLRVTQKLQNHLEKISLPESLYFLNIAFCQFLLEVGEPKKILTALYPFFIERKQIRLAIICLRQLFSLDMTVEQQKFYEDEINQLTEANLLENYEIDNMQSVAKCKQICQKVIKLSDEFYSKSIQQTEHAGQLQCRNIWQLIINYENKKITQSTQIQPQEKQVIQKNINLLKQESNIDIIRKMQKSHFFTNSLREYESTLTRCLINNLQSIVQRLSLSSLATIYDWSFKGKDQSKLERRKGNRVAHKKIFLQNNTSLRQIYSNNSHSRTISASKISQISDISLLPSIKTALTPTKSGRSIYNNQQRLKEKENTPTSRTFNLEKSTEKKAQSKLVAKMVRYCECGSFLSKRNYNSNGGEYRFVRLSSKVIKWAKNPQKIEDSCQLYPLKDIKSIHYGKCTPVLLKPTNNFLRSQLCFSLHLQKRTLDFHCKDSQQARNWVCGFTEKMKTIDPKFKGYSHGKFLWMKMFMKLRQHFTVHLRDHQKNYYYERAQAIVLFGKNGYQIPPHKNQKLI